MRPQLNPKTAEGARLVRKLIDYGFKQQRIAALFDVNQGRIAEINKNKNEKKPIGDPQGYTGGWYLDDEGSEP